MVGNGPSAACCRPWSPSSRATSSAVVLGASAAAVAVDGTAPATANIETWSNFHTGGTAVLMTWDSGQAVVTLYAEGVTKTAATFLERLPLEVPMEHVAWSGDTVMGARPVRAGGEGGRKPDATRAPW